MANEYLFGKGSVMVAERDANGSVSKVLYVGNCPELKVSGSVDRIKHYESESGVNRQDRNIVKTSEMEFSLVTENMSNDNLALIFWGGNATIDADTAAVHTFPTGIVAGETHIVPNAFALTPTFLKDSAGTPATVGTTKYELNNDFGTIKFLDVAGFTQPFKLTYDTAAVESVPFLTTQSPTRFIRFNGFNLANPGISVPQKFVVELYLAQFDLPSDVSFIGDDFGKFEMKGALQLDETRSSNSDLGGYGRIIKIPVS